ncbi:DUF1289 domain-containing protein [Arsukibacterium indicum]|uniref:DUF1289 domain-containing protein n=1 Tax=Arsukibacterium indicum TaxID=2848612 RepID=A0ABS6MPK3_9GAMM|nr:DUF1289 domain-containing protein [Arsukibacterium indicum]MBV2130745.1 DUF1289 domain-containing protein [Arsukibacterium indicum]
MIESPCVRNCCLDQQDICLGCGRLLAEILEWQQAKEPRQQQIVVLAQQRLAKRQTGLMHPAVTPCE